MLVHIMENALLQSLLHAQAWLSWLRGDWQEGKKGNFTRAEATLSPCPFHLLATLANS